MLKDGDLSFPDDDAFYLDFENGTTTIYTPDLEAMYAQTEG